MDNGLIKQLEVMEAEFKRGDFRALGRMQIIRRRLGLEPLRLINDLARILHEGTYYKPGDEIPIRGNLHPSMSKSIRRNWFHWEGLGDRPAVIEEPKAAPKPAPPKAEVKSSPEPEAAPEPEPKPEAVPKPEAKSAPPAEKKDSKSSKKSGKKTKSKKDKAKNKKKDDATFWDGESVDIEDIEDAMQED